MAGLVRAVKGWMLLGEKGCLGVGESVVVAEGAMPGAGRRWRRLRRG